MTQLYTYIYDKARKIDWRRASIRLKMHSLLHRILRIFTLPHQVAPPTANQRGSQQGRLVTTPIASQHYPNVAAALS